MMSQYHLSDVTFCSKHGEVCISKQNGLYTIILPSWEAQSNSVKVESLGVSDMEPLDVFSTRDIVLVLPNEECVANFNPHYNFLKKMEDHHALIVTAQNRSDGYVLRYFAPKIGIPEDIATGSAQCSLAPYWFSKLGVYSLTAHQLSSSGGYFKVEKESESSIKVFAQVKAREENI